MLRLKVAPPSEKATEGSSVDHFTSSALRALGITVIEGSTEVCIAFNHWHPSVLNYINENQPNPINRRFHRTIPRKLGKEIGLGDADKESDGFDGSLLGYINIPNATFVMWDGFMKTVAIDSMFTQIAENRAPILVALLEYTPAKQLSSIRHLQQYQDHFLACCKSTSLHEVVDFPVKVRESSSVRHDSCSFRKVCEVSGLTGCK